MKAKSRTEDSRRIVSLLPSSTEIVCALGREAQLVGRSHECDYPASVKGLPVCTRPKFSAQGGSEAIHRRVQSSLKDGLSLYEVDFERLKDLRPSHIMTQTQCEVCAVSLKEVEEAVHRLLASEPAVVSLSATSLEGLWSDIRGAAEALDCAKRGERLVQSLQGRMARIAEAARKTDARPRVVCVEWLDPLMAAGNWMPELVEMAGGVNVIGQAGAHSPWMSWEALKDADPDVLLLLPCGFDLGRTAGETPILSSRSGWGDLKAVREGQVFLLDGNQYFNRPGPRLSESLEILAEILHPRLFRFGHEGSGWMRL